MDRSDDYVIADIRIDTPVTWSVNRLLSRRDELVRAIVESVPEEARQEVAESLSRTALTLLHSIHDERLSESIAEIYAIDARLPPGIA